MQGRELVAEELETQLALTEATAQVYIINARRWLVALTLAIGLVAFLVTRSPWMGLATGFVAFVFMWSGFSATIRKYRLQVKKMRQQVILARRREMKSEIQPPVELYWPADHEQPSL